MKKDIIYRDAEIKLLKGVPALLLKREKALVVGDLHIGKDIGLAESGVSLPLASERMALEIRRLCTLNGAKSLIILGDVKESIGYPLRNEYLSIASFFILLRGLRITIAKGNHDAHLQEIFERLGIHAGISREILIGNTALMHGNAVPSAEALQKSRIIVGHGHTAVHLNEKLEKAWMVVEGRGQNHRNGQLLIVVPAFNPLIIGTTPERRGRTFLPILRRMPFKRRSIRLYDLDGRLAERRSSYNS